MHIRDRECTVELLLEELYKKAAASNLWGLVRHTAGMLHKRVEDLGPVSSGAKKCVLLTFPHHPHTSLSPPSLFPLPSPP